VFERAVAGVLAGADFGATLGGAPAPPWIGFHGIGRADAGGGSYPGRRARLPVPARRHRRAARDGERLHAPPHGDRRDGRAGRCARGTCSRSDRSPPSPARGRPRPRAGAPRGRPLRFTPGSRGTGSGGRRTRCWPRRSGPSSRAPTAPACDSLGRAFRSGSWTSFPPRERRWERSRSRGTAAPSCSSSIIRPRAAIPRSAMSWRRTSLAWGSCARATRCAATGRLRGGPRPASRAGEALDALWGHASGITRTQWRTLWAAHLGWALDAFDVMLYAFALGAIRDEFHLSAAQRERWPRPRCVASAAGGILFGVLADRLGRVRALVLSILTYSLFTALTATAQGMASFLLWRALVGFGLGGEWSAGTVLVAESWPAEHRGQGARRSCSPAGRSATPRPPSCPPPSSPAGDGGRSSRWESLPPCSPPGCGAPCLSPRPGVLDPARARRRVLARLAAPPDTWAAAVAVCHRGALRLLGPLHVAPQLPVGARRTGRCRAGARALCGFVVAVQAERWPATSASASSPTAGPSPDLPALRAGSCGRGSLLRAGCAPPQWPCSCSVRWWACWDTVLQRLRGDALRSSFPAAIRGTAQGLCYNAGRAVSAAAPYTLGLLADRRGLRRGPGLDLRVLRTGGRAGAPGLPETRGRSLA
jgi:hypothetical protein